MERYINCIAHSASEGKLLLGEKSTALFDCGMAFCADRTIENVKKALDGRDLDYIFITHTHYDHVGALPFFRKEWPGLQLVTSELGAAILLKPTPRKVIRELSLMAGELYNAPIKVEFNDDEYHADFIVKDGDVVPLGGLSVKVLEAPGHTRDSLCFFIPELDLLFVNESPGVVIPNGDAYPTYLTSYKDAVASLEKCRSISARYLSLPHTGIASEEISKVFFDRTLQADITCRDFIVDLAKKDPNPEEILTMFCEKYNNEELRKYQPKEAFMINARATIACTLREFPV